MRKRPPVGRPLLLWPNFSWPPRRLNYSFDRFQLIRSPRCSCRKKNSWRALCSSRCSRPAPCRFPPRAARLASSSPRADARYVEPHLLLPGSSLRPVPCTESSSSFAPARGSVYCFQETGESFHAPSANSTNAPELRRPQDLAFDHVAHKNAARTSPTSGCSGHTQREACRNSAPPATMARTFSPSAPRRLDALRPAQVADAHQPVDAVLNFDERAGSRSGSSPSRRSRRSGYLSSSSLHGFSCSCFMPRRLSFVCCPG